MRNILSYHYQFIPVSSITLDYTTILFNNAWDTQQITATVLPDNASDKTLIWTSSDTSIATVDQTGLVTCVTPGSCTITCTAKLWWVSETCSIIQAYEYSYDFRNKSWTQVQNDWWTLIQWTSWTTINSNGINFPTKWWWTSNKVRISYPIVLTWAKKITMEMTYYWAASDWWNNFNYTTRNSSSFDDWWTSMAWATTTASWYVWKWSGSSRNLTLRYDNSPVTWTYTSTATFDLTTKTMTFQRNWLSQLTWTIPDGDISIIRSMNILAIDWWHDIWTIQLRTIYIKVEY